MNDTEKRNKLNMGDFSLNLSGVMGCAIIMTALILLSILVGVAKAYWDKKAEDQSIGITIGNATQCNVTLSGQSDKSTLVPYGANLDEGETYKKYLGNIDINVNEKYLESNPNLYMRPTMYFNGEILNDRFRLELVQTETQDIIDTININNSLSFNLIENGVLNSKTAIDTFNLTFGMYISFIDTNLTIDTEAANNYANNQMTLLLEFLEEVEEYTSYELSGQIVTTQYREEFEGGGFSNNDSFNGYTVKLNDEGNFDSTFPLNDSIGNISYGLDQSNLFYKVKTEDGIDVSNLFRFRLEYQISSDETDYEYLGANEYIALDTNYVVYMEYSNTFNNAEVKSKLLGKTLQIEFIFAPTEIVEI